MKVTYRFPKQPPFGQRSDVHLDDTIPPDVGEIVVFRNKASSLYPEGGTAVYIVERRTFRMIEDDNFAGVYKPEVLVTLKLKEK